MKITKRTLVTAILVVLIICISKITYASTGIVTADLLNLRESPSTSAKVKLTLKKNQEMEIIEQDGVWYKVKINGTEGYVHGDYIKVKEETKVEEQKEEKKEEQEKKPSEINVKNSDTITVSKEIDIYILPLINANKISKTKQNEVVTVLGSTNKWLFVSCESVNGWILKSLVETANSQTQNTNTNNNNENNNSSNSQNSNNTNSNTQQNTENNNQNNSTNNSTTQTKTMYVNSASIYVRKGPGTNYDYVDTLVLNNDVTVIGEEGDWYKVKVNGKEGYIAKWLLSNKVTSRGDVDRTIENTESAKTEQVAQNTKVSEVSTSNVEQTLSIGEQVVEYAKKYLGCKYVYGGSGPSTFDCSGFTMYVYSKFGISLSHSAVTQAKKGTYVAKEDLQPGDLVFFKNYDTMEGIGHCGIYIGNGDFIHASSGTGYCVKISTLLTGHYETRYETARRVL